MRILALSDPQREQLHALRRQQLAAQAEQAAWERSYLYAYSQRLAARRRKPRWKRLLSVSTERERHAAARARSALRQVNEAHAGAQRAFREVRRESAGLREEQALERGLAALPNDWALLRGYRNRRGRTDYVLVGPGGLWAVDVRRDRVRLHVDGDQWWFEQLSAEGTVGESDWATDDIGRSWATQVNDVANDLTNWLRSNGKLMPVLTAVMLMHEQAQLGRCAKPSVDLIGLHPYHLLRAVNDRPTKLAPDTCDDIVRLVERDHRFHARQQADPANHAGPHPER